MADQGFRPFTTSAPTTMAQLHASSSSVKTAASTIIPTATPVHQMPVLPYHLQIGSICPADDGYIWKNLGVQEFPGSGRLISYECTQENCMVKKSVALAGDGQIFETIFRGSHNHPRTSEMWPRDDGMAMAGNGSGSQDCVVLPQIYVAGTSMPRPGEGDYQLPSSDDSDEDNEDEPTRADDGDICGNANDKERGALVPVLRSTGERASETLDGGLQQNANSHQRKRRRSKPSKVWDEFTEVSSGGHVQGAKCIHCKKCLSGKSTGGTSHLRRHLETCPARPATDRVQQQQLLSHPDSSVEKNSDVNQDKSLELLTRALVSNFFSFSMTSITNFRQSLAGISSTTDMISQASIEQKILSIFHTEKLKLKDEIAHAPGGIFLTVARWDLDYKYFLCVMAHFIDKEWNMKRKIISYSFLGCYDDECQPECYVSTFPASNWLSCYNMTTWNVPKVAEGIVKEVVQSWDLNSKLLGVLFPGSLDDTAIFRLEKELIRQNYLVAKCKLLTLPCIVHDLHDLVEDAINGCVRETSRTWFRYMICTNLRRDKYKEILSQLQINRPSLGSRNWHFNFYLLEAALQFNKAFPASHLSKQVKVAENYCDLVRPIYHAIKVISSSNVTSNLYFHSIWNLKIALLGLSETEDVFLKGTETEDVDGDFDIETIQEKFDKLWMKWYLWLSLAVILDPRYKIRFLAVCFKEALGSDAKNYLREVRGKLYELFLRYSCHVDPQKDEHWNERNNEQFDTNGRVQVHDRSQNYTEQSAHTEELGELIRYLEGDCIPENAQFDILKWWKDNASMYPTLASLARDILAIPVCAVSADSAFDKTDERASFFNQKMSQEVIEALICTKDWIKSSDINEEVGGNRNLPI